MVTAYGYLGTCATPPHPYLPSISAPRSHGKLRRRLTGTGVGSNFRFVVRSTCDTWRQPGVETRPVCVWSGDPGACRACDGDLSCHMGSSWLVSYLIRVPLSVSRPDTQPKYEDKQRKVSYALRTVARQVVRRDFSVISHESLSTALRSEDTVHLQTRVGPQSPMHSLASHAAVRWPSVKNGDVTGEAANPVRSQTCPHGSPGCYHSCWSWRPCHWGR